MGTIFEIYATETLGPFKGMFAGLMDENHAVRMDPGWSLKPYNHHNGGPTNPRRWTAEKIETIRRHVGRRATRGKELLTTISHTHLDHWNKGDNFVDKYPFIAPGEIDRDNEAYLIPGETDTIPLNGENQLNYQLGDWEVEAIRERHGALDGTNLQREPVYMMHVQTPDGSVLHTSDIGGPQYRAAADNIIRRNPDIVFLDGPFESYVYRNNGDWKNSVQHDMDRLENLTSSGGEHNTDDKAAILKRFNQSMYNMQYLVERLEGETDSPPILILDHHAERAVPPGRRWKVDHLKEHAREIGREDIIIGTASDFLQKGPFTQVPLQ